MAAGTVEAKQTKQFFDSIGHLGRFRPRQWPSAHTSAADMTRRSDAPRQLLLRSRRASIHILPAEEDQRTVAAVWVEPRPTVSPHWYRARSAGLDVGALHDAPCTL